MMNTQDPVYRARLEEIDAAHRAEDAKDPGIQTAQQALNAAQGKLSQEQHIQKNVALDPRWIRWTQAERISVEDQMAERVHAARLAVGEAETKLRSAENTAARNRWQAQLQAKKDAEKKERDQAQQQYAAQEEAQAKEQYRGAFLSHGGTEAQFEQAWPGLWQQELQERVTQSQEDTTLRDKYVRARGAI